MYVLTIFKSDRKVAKILRIHFNCDHLIPVETGLEMKKKTVTYHQVDRIP